MKIDLYQRLKDHRHPPYIVAEIGINHNGSLEIAKETIDAAINAGADAVKFQNYRTQDFIQNPNLEYTTSTGNEEVTYNLKDMFEKLEIGEDFLYEIKTYCEAKNIDWHSTPTHESGVEHLKKLKVNVMKNGSDFLRNLDLLKSMASCNLPLVLSTGMATLNEISDAVEIVEQNGLKEIILLHCTSQYPTADCEVNLKRMKWLSKVFEYPVGFSDHTIGPTAALGAVACGARWLEKHFTLDNNLDGPDHSMSTNPADFAAYVREVRRLESMLAGNVRNLSLEESKARREHMLSCCYRASMTKGQTITASDIVYGRPGNGIPPREAKYIIGRKVKCDVAQGSIVSIMDLE